MNYEELLKRLNMQSISKFILHGDEYADGVDFDDRLLPDRLESYEEDYINELKVFQENILKSDWLLLDEQQAETLFEDIINEVVRSVENLNSTYFELGLTAGFNIMKDCL